VSKFSKAANHFEIWTRHCSLPTTSLNILRLKLSIWNVCVSWLITASLSLIFATTK
jgi:hypothetical protein